MPADYGGWSNTHRRFCRWRDKGHGEGLLEKMIQEPDLEWPMIDASHVKAHAHAAGAIDGNDSQKGAEHETTSGRGCALRVMVTADPVADCTQAESLIKDLPVHCLLADKGYDTNAIAEGAPAGRHAGRYPSAK